MAKTFFDFVNDVSEPGGEGLFKEFCECQSREEIKTLLDWGLDPPDPPDPGNGYSHPYQSPDPQQPDNPNLGVPLGECQKLMDMKESTGLMEWPPPPAY